MFRNGEMRAEGVCSSTVCVCNIYGEEKHLRAVLSFFSLRKFTKKNLLSPCS